MSAPVAERRSHTHEIHGDRREDPWCWLRDREDPAVMAHLQAENAHTEAALAHIAPLADVIYHELKARLKEDDVTVPVRQGDWAWYSRTEEGKAYPIHCRRRWGVDGPVGPEEVVLDANREAEGQPFFALGGYTPSPDGELVAWAADLDGSERYLLRFRVVATGEDLPDRVDQTSPGVAWYDDGRTLLYLTHDAQMRPHRVHRHVIGEDAHTIVCEDRDERFFVGVHRDPAGRWIVVKSQSKLTTGLLLLPTADPSARPVEIQPKVHGVEAEVVDAGDRLVLRTNEEALNFRVLQRLDGADGWTELFPHRRDEMVEEIEALAGHVLLLLRRDGQRRVRWHHLASGRTGNVTVDRAVFTMSLGPHRHFDSTRLRFTWESPVDPTHTEELDLATGQRKVLKVQEVLGGYDAGAYETRREWATAPDGARVPIDLWHRRDVTRTGENPLLLVAYGSYGFCYEPFFSTASVSLVDRGFVCALAHPRGGGELGRAWYDGGRLTEKENTFTDVIACADHLVARGWTRPDRMGLRGGSAGGLMVGAVLNRRPELFAACLVLVPFVDLLTTMLDDTLPLTVTEWEEWGDPRVPRFYEAMRRYSPYDNVPHTRLPAILATAGLNDPRVGFWEPAKWVQRLRERDTGGRPILLKTNLGAGHTGASGRYERLREVALEQAFLVDRLGG